ncbi:ATP-binding protein [Caulobacter endophyticus]|uniref:ATP-binding protein n=1 Tax=Caulobacter endophyticus TaxID=2172652 RepID=UPI00240FCFA4|nr:ATP-binding protein [Caulobacter endophyticus]
MRQEDWYGIAHRRVREFPLRLFFSVGIAAAIYLNHASAWPAVWLVATVAAQLVTSWLSRPMRKAGCQPSEARKRLFIGSVALSTAIFASVAPAAWFNEGWQGRVLAVTVLAGGVMNVRLHASSSAAMLWAGTTPFICLLIGLPIYSLATEPGKGAAAFVCLANLMYVAHLAAATRRGLADARAVATSLALAQQTADALKEAAAKADAANDAKSQFLANMSHEIRTPLNGVLGVAGALARTPLTQAQRSMVELVETSARTLETLLTDILDLARIEAGKLELRAEPFDLAASVGACAELFDAAAQAKGLDLTVDIGPDAAGIFVGDAIRIRQVVTNLLSNAVKFTSAGQVRLSVRVAETKTNSTVIFEVCDTGIGFDEKTKARLFSRFEQADGSNTRSYGGSGLGLAISQSLAQAMGGRLEAEGRCGQGATFTFAAPLPRGPAPAHEAAAPAGCDAQVPLAGMRVLLAEDHPTNRRVVELILGATGIDLISVENGAEAVAAYQHGAFDMILMDMQMPVMDGLTAIRRIRALEAAERRPRTQIHVLTANAMPEHVQASLAAGADGHLSKPIQASLLIERCGAVFAPRPDLARAASE